MTRDAPPGTTLYDTDFHRWTQREAAALRALPPDGAAAQLDVANLAVEIADLGKRDLREVMSYLGLVIQHLVKLRATPGSRDAAHWHAEAVDFQLAARRAFSPGMRRLLDVDDSWAGGCRAARRFLQDAGAGEPQQACPFTLDDLLALISTWRRRRGASFWSEARYGSSPSATVTAPAIPAGMWPAVSISRRRRSRS